MTDREFYDALKERRKAKKRRSQERHLNKSKSVDDGGWIKHNTYHWSRVWFTHDTGIAAHCNYWPSTGRASMVQENGDVRYYNGRAGVEFLTMMLQSRHGSDWRPADAE